MRRAAGKVKYISYDNAYLGAEYSHSIEALKYFCINNGDQRVFQFEIIINVLDSYIFPLYLNML